MPSKRETRIAIKPQYQQKVAEILEQTGIETPTQLFSILLVNFGDVLVAAIKTAAVAHSIAHTTQLSTKSSTEIKPTAPLQKQPFKPMGGF
jgi:hypothetical protein